MKAMLWTFRAIDTFFIRNGFPFQAGESGQGGVSRFPPLMTTIQGAIRTALATVQGWTPEKPERWPVELGTADHLGQLVLRGPYLRRGKEWLLPAPLFLLRKGTDKECVYLRLFPGEEVECDLGRVRLPTALGDDAHGARTMENSWLTQEGWQKVQKGGLPQAGEVMTAASLWQEEKRVGLAREQKRRTALEGMLYSATHIRPVSDLEVAVYVGGVPVEWQKRVQTEGGLLRFGGEGRLAQVTISNAESFLGNAPQLTPEAGKIRFTVTLITPGYYGDAAKTENVIRQGPPGVPGRCICACLGRLVLSGGWDLQKGGPRKLRRFLPVGSTWFFEADAAARETVEKLHQQCLGEEQNYGFGQMIIGRWEE